MNAPDPGHREYAEFAAGFALNALEPDDERRFVVHAASCASCRIAAAGFSEVTETLAELAPPAEPARDLAAAIAAAAEAGRPATTAPLLRVPGDARPRPGARSARARPRRARVLLAVAAAALVAAGGIWAGVIRGPAASPRSSASCAAAGRCHQVVLTLASSGGRTAKVRVRNGSVWLLPGKLPPDRTARQVYVLWQITGARSPKAVGSFDVSPGHRGPIRIGALPRAYSGTRAFAVSLEPGRAIPVRPSHLVAFGLVGD